MDKFLPRHDAETASDEDTDIVSATMPFTPAGLIIANDKKRHGGMLLLPRQQATTAN